MKTAAKMPYKGAAPTGRAIGSTHNNPFKEAFMSTVQAITAGVQARLIRRRCWRESRCVCILAASQRCRKRAPAPPDMACRDDAFIEMGICYLNALGYLSKVRCNIAFELDLWGCNADLVDVLNPLFQAQE